MTDIANIVTTERIIEIHHPADESKLLGIRVSVMAISDPRLKRIKRKIQDERLRLEARGKSLKSDDIEENNHLLAFEGMTGWEWYGKDVSFHGKKPDFTKANVIQVFTELEWFFDQISSAISEEKDFFDNSKSD